MTADTTLPSLTAVADHLGRGDVAVVGPLQLDCVVVTGRGGVVLVDAIDMNTEAERAELIRLLRQRFTLVHVAATAGAAAWACAETWPSLRAKETMLH
jgi:hypothetical protein